VLFSCTIHLSSVSSAPVPPPCSCTKTSAGGRIPRRPPGYPHIPNKADASNRQRSDVALTFSRLATDFEVVRVMRILCSTPVASPSPCNPHPRQTTVNTTANTAPPVKAHTCVHAPAGSCGAFAQARNFFFASMHKQWPCNPDTLTLNTPHVLSDAPS
jgi:hypothetical protein